tara:strand:+ start:269 stop:484 length:216 start_codon:yes stop_codon:yes gene_type:complete
MPAFCIIQNHNTKESFMWVGRNETEGKWFPSGPDQFDGMEEFVKVLENHPDPEQLLFEIGSIWSKEDEEND